MPVGLPFLLFVYYHARGASLQFNPRLARVVDFHMRFGIVGEPVLLVTGTVLEDDTRRAEVAAVLLPDVIEMNFVEEGLDGGNKVGNVRVIDPELTKSASVFFVLFELDLLDLTELEFVEYVSYILLGYASKSHDKDASHYDLYLST